MLRVLAAAGAGGALGRELAALADSEGRVTVEMIQQAEWLTGLRLDPEERELMLGRLSDLHAGVDELRAVELDNSVPPALTFDPTPGRPADLAESGVAEEAVTAEIAAGGRLEDEPLFGGVRVLAAALRRRELTSVELTRRALERIDRYDPQLRCVITRTDELALEQAERADRELAAGIDRGPLHGLPWGAKDLLAVPGYRTTWGATTHRDQTRPEHATVARKLEEAGAVLVAKTSVGALAWGDVWFDGQTKNPWKVDEGSSGSSAGSASGTAAGLMTFAIGTETLGSIVSPCTVCGTSGLRPTFGRVSRHGVMALSWSMDKVGTIARSVDDCALAFAAIHGADPHDPTARSAPFSWSASGLPDGRLPADVRVGYVEADFAGSRVEGVEDEIERQDLIEWQAHDRTTVRQLLRLGFQLVPMALPDDLPVAALRQILWVEAATAFDELTRSGRDEQLVRQVEWAWPNFFRVGQMVPAVEYLRANRIRTLLMKRMEEVLSEIDLYVSPSWFGSNLTLTSLTGHPQVVVPNGFRSSDGTPTSITFTGRHWDESTLLAVARAYQEATDFHRARPGLTHLARAR